MESLLYNLIFILILILIPLNSSQEWCPSDCTCKTDGRNNHAKCTSLNGLLETKNLPIHSLDLSNANLTKINHLDKLRVLTTINLSHNKLSDIGHLGQRVKSINLSHNKITSAKLINIPRYIEELDLSYNEITYLPLEMSKIALRKLELFGNKINCTCDTLEVRNWLVHNSVFTSHPVKCTYPVELKGTLWLQIKQEQYCKTDKIEENTNNSKMSKLVKIDDDNENELMLGDAPILDGSEEKDTTDGAEELGKDYLPINTKTDEVIDENVLEGSGLSHLEMRNDHDGNQETPSSQIIEQTIEEMKSNETKTEQNDDDTDGVEGSGGGIINPPTIEIPKSNETETGTENNEDEIDGPEGSGSGMGISIIPPIDTNLSNESEINATISAVDSDDVTFVETEKPESDESTPIAQPFDTNTTTDSNESIPGGLGIFGIKSDEEKDENSTDVVNTESPTEPPIIPVHVSENESENIEGITNGNAGIQKDDMIAENIDKAEAGESNGTYILLGTILIILICLLMYVGLKRTIAKRKRNERDAERAAELVEMDKKNLGKPLQKNGHEQKPLIVNENIKPTSNGNTTSAPTKKPYNDTDQKIQEPLLNGHHKDPHDDESNNNLTPKQSDTNQIPIPEPRQSLQQNQNESPNQQPSSPRVHSPRYGHYPPKSPRSQDSIDRGGDSPSSPKAGRYSPVYSPETGKVKIKLSEVPKPKTPMLITKSASKAGEIITTPTSDVVDSGTKQYL